MHNPVKVLEYDEYVVINSKDKIDRQRQPTREHEDDKEMTSEHLIKAFSPYTDDTKEEVHKLPTNKDFLIEGTNKQNSSQRRILLNSSPARRPITRLYKSMYSNNQYHYLEYEGY